MQNMQFSHNIAINRWLHWFIYFSSSGL